jgi:hypothetical protein
MLRLWLASGMAREMVIDAAVDRLAHDAMLEWSHKEGDSLVCMSPVCAQGQTT